MMLHSIFKQKICAVFILLFMVSFVYGWPNSEHERDYSIPEVSPIKTKEEHQQYEHPQMRLEAVSSGCKTWAYKMPLVESEGTLTHKDWSKGCQCRLSTKEYLEECAEAYTEERSKVSITFNHGFSGIHTSEDNLDSLPLMGVCGLLRQTCWISSWEGQRQTIENIAYDFLLPKTIRLQSDEQKNCAQKSHEQKNLPLGFIQQKNQHPSKNFHSNDATKESPLPAPCIHFNYNIHGADNLFSMNISLNPWQLFHQLHEGSIQLLSSLPILDSHPYFQQFDIVMAREGHGQQKTLVLEFRPKAQADGSHDNKHENHGSAQPFKNSDCDLFMNKEVIIPKQGKKLGISCVDEHQQISLRIKGIIPSGFVPLLASFISPLTDMYANGTEGFSINTFKLLLGIAVYCNTYVAVTVETLRFARMAGTCLIYMAAKKGGGFLNRFCNLVTQKGKSASRTPLWLLGLFGLSQLASGEAVDNTTAYLTRLTWLHNNELMNPIHSLGLDCLCREFNFCKRTIADSKPDLSNYQSRLISEADKIKGESYICNNFCLKDEYKGMERCDKARKVFSSIIDAADIQSRSTCMAPIQNGYAELVSNLPGDTPISATGPDSNWDCLNNYLEDMCRYIRIIGPTDSKFCDFCDASENKYVRCNELPTTTAPTTEAMADLLESTTEESYTGPIIAGFVAAATLTVGASMTYNFFYKKYSPRNAWDTLKERVTGFCSGVKNCIVKRLPVLRTPIIDEETDPKE